ncbi:MAG: DUF4835 family protein [Candidatus Hatepunaea meridiana]|nr:DUF4835 family protein [Candidatus Hatepunaea meridiana]
MKTIYHFILYTAIALVLFIGLIEQVLAQQIKCEVVFHTERLPLEEQQYLDGLDLKLARTINGYSWMSDGYNYELPVRIELFFEKYSIYGAYHKYGAGVMVATRKGIQLRDKRWDFRVNRTDHLHIGDPYDTFTGLLEFYIWMCLGYEADRLTNMGGQPFYEKARTTAEKALFENQYYTGWDHRRELIDDMIESETYKNIRSVLFHVEAGFYYIGKNELKKAHPYLVKAAEQAMKTSPKLIELKRDGHIIRFIDLEKFVKALESVEEFDLLDRLAVWDSENSDIYK